MTIASLQAHDDVQARIWSDKRGMPPGTREVALAMAWALYREPEHAPGKAFWNRVRVLLGHEGYGWRSADGEQHVQWRLHNLIAGDAPRYDPGNWHHGPGPCEGPRLRPYKPRRPAHLDRCYVSDHHPHLGDCWFPATCGGEEVPRERSGSVCGADASIKVTEQDMVTGWETDHWFCRRHCERARAVRAQLAARGEPPEPVPNTGGLLPRYFAADWAAVYRKNCGRARGGLVPVAWEPPYYGCDADDWPVLGRDPVPRRPRLALVGT